MSLNDSGGCAGCDWDDDASCDTAAAAAGAADADIVDMREMEGSGGDWRGRVIDALGVCRAAALRALRASDEDAAAASGCYTAALCLVALKSMSEKWGVMN